MQARALASLHAHQIRWRDPRTAYCFATCQATYALLAEMVSENALLRHRILFVDAW